MTKDEKIQWGELYDYIKNNVLKYDKNLRVPKYFILRLKGLSEGKFISNKKIQSMGSYSFKDILLTFKLSKPEIDKTLWNRTKFKDEQHMVNSIMFTIERKINDVVNKIKIKEKSQEKTEQVQISQGSDVQYNKKTTKSKVADMLSDIM